MEFLGVGALSSSQLLVVFAFALFATIIFSSIYIRVRGQYQGRNKLPDHTQKRRFGIHRRRNSELPSVPRENHEVVTGARKKNTSDGDGEFIFNFDEPQKPTGPIEHATPDLGVEISPPDVPIENWENDISVTNGHVPQDSDYESSTEDDSSVVYSIEIASPIESSVNGVNTNTADEYPSQTLTATWDTDSEEDASWYESEATNVNTESPANAEHLRLGMDKYQPTESEIYDDEVQSSANDDYVPATGYPDAVENAADSYDVQEEGPLVASDVGENVVPFDNRITEAKRVGTVTNAAGLSISVVSVCLISDDEGQIFRDIKGEHLVSFLRNRGFIYLDEEYHLQHKSMVEKGAIRVRNYEDMPIGALVKQNSVTRGFRLYFRPSDCTDPLATLNEMLKIANLAIGFFRAVSSKPLVIYDGRKDMYGNISPLTQGDYNELKRDLSIAFPRILDDTLKRTAVTRNEYAPSEDLPTQVEQY